MPENNENQKQSLSETGVNPEISNVSNGLDKGQKLMAIVLAFFGFMIIVLWGWQFKSSLHDPLSYKPINNSQDSLETGICADGSCDEPTEDQQRLKDTDGDGLNNWDELNIYNTSPYLEDSDSDGFSDKEEIDNDENPNCPAGRDCLGYDPLYNEDAQEEIAGLNDAVSQFDLSQLNLDISAEAVDQDLGQAMLSGELDAVTLRELLVQAGLDKEILDQISDDELMKNYQETLVNQQ